jgi:hypothetical protein
MGMLRYILQGIGWEVGRTAAKEGIEHLREEEARAKAPPMSATERAKADKRAAKEAQRAKKRAAKDAKRAAKAKAQAKKAEAKAIDRELADLKKKLDD